MPSPPLLIPKLHLNLDPNPNALSNRNPNPSVALQRGRLRGFRLSGRVVPVFFVVFLVKGDSKTARQHSKMAPE